MKITQGVSVTVKAVKVVEAVKVERSEITQVEMNKVNEDHAGRERDYKGNKGDDKKYIGITL